jgi:hypothetical protein
LRHPQAGQVIQGSIASCTAIDLFLHYIKKDTLDDMNLNPKDACKGKTTIDFFKSMANSADQAILKGDDEQAKRMVAQTLDKLVRERLLQGFKDLGQDPPPGLYNLLKPLYVSTIATNNGVFKNMTGGLLHISTQAGFQQWRQDLEDNPALTLIPKNLASRKRKKQSKPT